MIRHNDIEIYGHLGLIRRGDKAVRLTIRRPDASRISVRFFLLKYLILGWHDVVQLFDLLYREQEDGGPIEGHHLVWILLNQASQDIRTLGLQLVWQKNGRCLRQYHLEPIGDDTT